MTYNFSSQHFNEGKGSLVYEPNFNPHDYQLMELIMEAERNIGALARLGLKNHPLKPTILRNSMVRTAHFTTKIEQNKLEYKEVEQLYENYKVEGLSTSQKFKLEVRNVFEAYDYLYKLNPLRNFSDMDEQVLKNIHEYLMKDLTGHPNGYRLIPVSLQDGDGQASYIPPSYNDVPSLMGAFFNWLYTSVTGYKNQYDQHVNHQSKIHPLLISGITHHVIGYIHPFPDGNGRTARAFSTLVALIHPDLNKIKDAFSVEEFFDKRIDEYYDSLMLATQGDLKPFLMFYLECINASLMKVLNELQRYDRIKHTKELLGKGHARTMFEIVTRMEDGEHFHRQIFDDMLNASASSIAKSLSKLRELNVIQPGDSRGEYIVTILD